MKSKFFVLFLLSVFLLSACNLPTGNAAPQTSAPDAALTAAAQTVQAVLTDSAAGAPSTGEESGGETTAPPTLAPPTPTQTPHPPTPTLTPRPCNQATFVADATIPDGTELPPGNHFTKVWRLKNIGTCSWTTDYALVFDSGDQMGGPAVQQLTKVVNPGETVDISVDLIAPNSAGSYRGYWRLRDAGGNIFGLSSGNAFWVDIKVVPSAPTFVFVVTPPLQILGFNVTVTPTNEGQVDSNGHITSGVTNAGDTSNDFGLQAFATYDLSGIAPGFTIDKVEIVRPSYDTLGTPFADLGCLRAYITNYGTLDAGDYYTGSPTGAVARWCSEAEIGQPREAGSGLVSYIQNHLGGQVQLRFEFNGTETDNDGVADVLRGKPQLIIYYH